MRITAYRHLCLQPVGYRLFAVTVFILAQTDKHLAAKLAVEMFAANSYLGLACGYLLLFYATWRGRNTVSGQRFFRSTLH